MNFTADMLAPPKAIIGDAVAVPIRAIPIDAVGDVPSSRQRTPAVSTLTMATVAPAGIVSAVAVASVAADIC